MNKPELTPDDQVLVGRTIADVVDELDTSFYDKLAEIAKKHDVSITLTINPFDAVSSDES